MADDQQTDGNSQKDIYDVLVLGAGVSGLSAAYYLKKKDQDCKVLVLEAKDRVGGRTFAVDLKSPNGTDVWDMGGQWVCETQTKILELMEELNLEHYEQYFTGTKLMQLKDGKIRKYDGRIPSVNVFSLLDINNMFSKVGQMHEQVPLEDVTKCANAILWDGMTVESFKLQNVYTASTSQIFDIALGGVFGAEGYQMSMLYFLHYSHSAGGFNVVCESGKGSAQEWKIKGGAYQVSQRLVEKIGNESVLLGHPVVSMKQDEEGVNVRTLNGKSFHTKYVIIAIPPHQTGKIHFDPPLPYNKEHIIQYMPVGHLIKFVVTYSSAFWRETGLSGEIIHFTSDADSCKDDPVSLVFDATTSTGSPALVGFISGYASSTWTHKKDEEIKSVILKSLEKFLGEKASDPLDIAIKDWAKEPWNGGCPVDLTLPGAFNNYGDSFEESFDRIHFAGTETARQWRGYIDGAVRSGDRAANEVHSRLVYKM